MKDQIQIHHYDLTVYLPSILFNNRKSIDRIFNILLLSLVVGNFIFLESKYLFYIVIIYLPVSLIAMLLITPRKLVLNQTEIRYHNIWKEKWVNIKNYTADDNMLIIKTFNNKERRIKVVQNEDIEVVVKYINERINVVV